LLDFTVGSEINFVLPFKGGKSRFYY